MRTKPLVIVTRRLPDATEAVLDEWYDTRFNHDDVPMSAEALKAAVAEADVLVPTVTDKIGADIIEAAGPQFGLIANFGVGYNHIDVKAAAARNIQVTNTPGVLTDATADIGMTLMLMVTRRAVEGMKVVEAGQFAGWRPTWMMGPALGGRPLGIIGMGRIGEAMARRAKAFGMKIHYHNRKRVDASIERELDATYWPDLDAMLPEMDIVSINTPSTAETRHLFNAERLARMKPTAYLINTARGDIVDEAALAGALEQGALGGAGLDVYEFEPKVHPGLIGRPNVVLLPHLGSSTFEARHGMGDKVIANIDAYAMGQDLPDRVA